MKFMITLVTLFGNSNSTTNENLSSILEYPGDKLDARITDSNRQVVKISKDRGNTKYSETRYPNGTVVQTKSTKNTLKRRGMK